VLGEAGDFRLWRPHGVPERQPLAPPGRQPHWHTLRGPHPMPQTQPLLTFEHEPTPTANGHLDNSALRPTRNFSASIHQWVLGVLELQDSRPCQVVGAVEHPLKDREGCYGFAGDAVLALVSNGRLKQFKSKYKSTDSVPCYLVLS
jgi:hypothetical protein